MRTELPGPSCSKGGLRYPLDKLLSSSRNMYEKLVVATRNLHRTKIEVYDSLACAEISPKASTGKRLLRVWKGGSGSRITNKFFVNSRIT